MNCPKSDLGTFENQAAAKRLWGRKVNQWYTSARHTHSSWGEYINLTQYRHYKVSSPTVYSQDGDMAKNVDMHSLDAAGVTDGMCCQQILSTYDQWYKTGNVWTSQQQQHDKIHSRNALWQVSKKTRRWATVHNEEWLNLTRQCPPSTADVVFLQSELALQIDSMTTAPAATHTYNIHINTLARELSSRWRCLCESKGKG